MVEAHSTIGQVIRCKAAVAWEANKPLDVTEIEVAPPKAGEIRVKVISNALCHTDIYTLEGHDSEGLFPCILGHEATGIVESIGEGVTSVQIGDTVIPCYTPQCGERDCVFCQSQKTNLCPKIRAFQGKGVMPDGTSRFSKDGKPIFHFMGCSTFSEYTVIAEISAAKINPTADLNKVCVLGCGVSTGWGAAMINPVVKPGSSVAVWGLGAVGLAVIQAAKLQGAGKIYGIDVNENKFDHAKKFGADECMNPMSGDSKDWLLQREKWGIEYTYDCTGNVAVMRTALEAAHRGFGESCVIGVAAAGKEISTRPFQLVTGRQWKGTAFGGWKSRQDVPKLVNKVVLGELKIDDFITHNIDGLENVNQSIDALHSGDCLRAVVKIAPHQQAETSGIRIVSSIKYFGGSLKTVKHWSKVNNSEMTFMIYLPDEAIKDQRGEPYPVLYCLSGLTATHENFAIKSHFGPEAQENKIAVVFPDTSARDTGIEGIKDDWAFGEGAGFYVDATEQKYSKHFNMYSYVNEELPALVNAHFPIDPTRKSVTGFSMGGLGALTSYFRNAGKYRSVSAFAPIAHPSAGKWGQNAFKKFFGSVEGGLQYDPTHLVQGFQGPPTPILIDQGSSDKWSKEELYTEDFLAAAHKARVKVDYRLREGYSHDFFYLASFIGEHIKFHARYLRA